VNRGSSGFLRVDAEGRLVIPANLAQRFGLHPGSRVYFVEDGSEVHFTRPVSHLARVYVERTLYAQITWAGRRVSSCPFVEKGSLSVRWDGNVSPCLPLLHDHESYLDDHIRRSCAYSVGNVNEQSLQLLWNAPAYLALRERLQVFDFSPCVYCNSCEMSEHNREDCFGNVTPTCGGCLWAQGLIQCP